ncbi:MAG: nucleotidyltransferase domain-containing protein [Nanoarchaeota archaeon]|nr:nucleotidyltransferase domain-containing protein [Nanoarchaeota archaeon]MBU1321682.1 nucleotidyltransferase domain-containing protein [Nanoarchaeota archaeon]MBU1598077.1 nucleotidyltransferase domain-containing protein [Nanoarchaeota archaeon]MBU2441631.1 nucleotidyltransferase domain-containing protein [Nanoarchaeota archaeon]
MDNLLKLIQTLGKNLNNQIPIRQLSKESKVPYTTTHRLINNNKEIFIIDQKGNIKLVSLNLRDNITKNYLILAERKETEQYLNKNPEFQVLKKEIPSGNYSLILFGSRAEGKQREKSDIDLCIINKDGKKNINFSKFELLFKLEINPIYLKHKEFKLMLKEEEQNLAKEIIKKHIILYGEEYFWNLIWKNGI